MENKLSVGIALGATGVLFAIIIYAIIAHANPMVPAVNTDMNCPAISDGIPDVIGSSDGIAMTCFTAPTSMGPQGPTGATGSQGSTGATGATGSAGSNAQNYGARVATDSSGLYVWTFPSGCQHSGNIPYFNAIAEGPTPQGGVTVNPQVEGTPTATTVSFRATKLTATTVALIGLTILSVPGNSVTELDLTCAPQ